MRGGILRQPVRKGFTLIELIISMAIISLLIALILPNIDRSLSKNNVANDAELFKAKVEEVRLLAGSTQIVDETDGDAGTIDQDNVGYYAIMLDLQGFAGDYFSLVRISYPLSNASLPCAPNRVATQARDESGPCFVQRVKVSSDMQRVSGNHDRFFLAFTAPTQQFTKIQNEPTGWQEYSHTSSLPVFQLTNVGKTAKVKLDDFTGRVHIEYE